MFCSALAVRSRRRLLQRRCVRLPHGTFPRLIRHVDHRARPTAQWSEPATTNPPNAATHTGTTRTFFAAHGAHMS